jgi:hypothetical protein
MSLDILFLDLATNTGWARGEAAKIPNSGSVRLGPGGLGPGRLGVWLRDHKRHYGKPDLIGLEKWLNIRASMNDRSVEVALRLNGACHAIAGVYGIKVVEIPASTIRAAVCGRAHAGDRKATKAMVVKTAKLLNLMPADATDDDDRADSLLGWRYCEAVYGRSAPAEFVLTGA